jgi:biotin-dependent carboxylase-like uncharacterized protein
MSLTVVRAGPLTTVQDLGRPGYAHLGVPRSGAADRPALRRANRMAGNPEDAAGLETTLLGTTVRLDEARWIAVAGAPAELTVDRQPVRSPVEVAAGATVTVGRARRGLRSYLAVSGGIAVPPVLGSRSTDRLSGLGPAPLRDGDTLPLGPPAAPGDRDAPGDRGGLGDRDAPGDGDGLGDRDAPGDREEEPEPPDEPILRLRPGPRDDWFAAGALDLLAAGAYTVSMDSDRVGLRLAGPELTRAHERELPSEGLVLGAVQVPADGRPVLFLADHPTTGGYPVIGVVHPDDVPLAAQARPGTRLRFRVEAYHPV